MLELEDNQRRLERSVKSALSYDPQLTEDVKTSHKTEIDNLFDNLDIEPPSNYNDASEYKLYGEISLVQGYEDSFQFDVMKGNPTKARFQGTLDYKNDGTGEDNIDNTINIDEVYTQLATEVFHPLQQHDYSDMMEADKGRQEAISD